MKVHSGNVGQPIRIFCKRVPYAVLVDVVFLLATDKACLTDLSFCDATSSSNRFATDSLESILHSAVFVQPAKPSNSISIFCFLRAPDEELEAMAM